MAGNAGKATAFPASSVPVSPPFPKPPPAFSYRQVGPKPRTRPTCQVNLPEQGAWSGRAGKHFAAGCGSPKFLPPFYAPRPPNDSLLISPRSPSLSLPPPHAPIKPPRSRPARVSPISPPSQPPPSPRAPPRCWSCGLCRGASSRRSWRRSASWSTTPTSTAPAPGSRCRPWTRATSPSSRCSYAPRGSSTTAATATSPWA
jgi:hypothetical protein